MKSNINILATTPVVTSILRRQKPKPIRIITTAYSGVEISTQCSSSTSASSRAIRGVKSARVGRVVRMCVASEIWCLAIASEFPVVGYKFQVDNACAALAPVGRDFVGALDAIVAGGQ